MDKSNDIVRFFIDMDLAKTPQDIDCTPIGEDAPMPQDHSPAFALCGELTIFHAQALKEQILGFIQQATSGQDIILIELDQVTDIDTAGLQLMLMAKREASAQHKQLSFSKHSSAVLDALELCNLSAQLGDPILVSAH